jgi:hypothetical protein
MKRKFGRVITPQKFGKLVELIYDQAVGKAETEEGKKIAPCKQSQKLIFEYAMVKPGFEPENQGGTGGVQIIINDMQEKTIEGEVIDDQEEG